MEKKRKLIILGVIALVLVISGMTYAILTWTSSKINIGLTSNCFTIDYTKGQDITNQGIKLINEEDLINDGKFTIKEGIALTYANIGIKSTCTIEGYGILKLNVTSLSDAFITGASKNSLKYAVLKNTSSSNTITVDNLKDQSFDLVARGGITKLGTIDILTEQLSNTELHKYLIVVYIDNNLAGNDVIGSSFTGNISAEAYQGKLPLADAITSSFSTTSIVTNNSIDYEYDTTHNLMKDIGGNIRYYGVDASHAGYAWQTVGSDFFSTSFTSEEDCINYVEETTDCATNYSDWGYSSQSECESDLPSILNNMTVKQAEEFYCSRKIVEPSNYIYFNCSDYSNQSSSTCETWRIIGVFDGRLKLIRNSPIESLAWDQDKNDDSSKTTTFDNDWSTATLQKLLNGSYYNGTGLITYYSGVDISSTSTTLDMTSIGIKNATTRSLISDTTYYLGGWDSSSVYPNQIYEYERGTKVYTGRPTTWTGKIALPYPSDYGYAADLNQCKEKTLYGYSDSTCTSNNWMKTIFTANNNWFLTPHSGVDVYVWYVTSSGCVMHFNSSSSANGVTPVLNLNSKLVIKSGTGTSLDPYQLSV